MRWKNTLVSTYDATDICTVGGVDATPPVAADAEAKNADYVR